MLTIATKDDKEIILLGDMNCHYSKTSDNQNLKDVIKINGLKQMITEPTRVTGGTSSLIDIVLTTHKENILKSFVSKSSMSDHDLIGVIRKINCTKYLPKKITTRNYK